MYRPSLTRPPFQPQPLHRPLPPSTGVLFDAASNSGDQTAVSSVSFSVIWAGSNRMLVIDVPFLNAAGSVSTVTYGGATCTLISAQNVVGGTGRVEQWRICQNDSGAPAAGSNTLLITYSGVIADTSVCWTNYVNVHQTSPTESWNGNSGINTGSATDATVVVTPTTDQTWCHFALATSQTSGIASSNTSRNLVPGTGGTGGDSDTGGMVSPASAQTGRWTGNGITSAWAAAGFAVRPDTAVSGTQTATPGVGGITITGAAPASSGTGTSTSTPDVATVVVSGIAPAASGTGTATSTPSTCTVTITGIAPSASATGSASCIPSVGVVTITGIAPAVSGTGISISVPATGTVSITGISPDATGTGIGTSIVGVGTIAISGVSPTSSGTGISSSVPGTGTITISGVSPDSSGTGTGTATSGIATVTIVGIAPSGTAIGSVTLTPSVGTITVSAASPTGTAIGSATATPVSGTVTISGTDALAFGAGTQVGTPGVGTVTLVGITPSVTATGNVTETPLTSQVLLTAADVGVIATGAATLTPAASQVTISAFAVSVSGTGTATVLLDFAAIAITVTGTAPLPPTVFEPPGYIFRRDQKSLDRVFRRDSDSCRRIWRSKPIPVGIGGNVVPLPSLNVDTLLAAVGDDRFYGFDLSPIPELIAGQTVASVTIIPSSVPGLTIGSPIVNSTVFDGIQPGFLIVVQVSGGTAKTVYKFAARVVLTDGSVIIIPARMLKLSSY